MGRQLRRVAVDFDWPLKKIWPGFENPYYKYCKKCLPCEGSGLNPQTKKISEDWYTHSRKDGRQGWSKSLTLDEVEALVKKGRLSNVRVGITIKEIHSLINSKGYFHDSINQWICVKVRAKRLGVYGQCEYCNGNGEKWDHPLLAYICDNFQEIHPPTGDAYQIWETVSDGSPVSPAFDSPEDLARWMVENDTSITSDTTFGGWMKFILGEGWAPSAMISNGKFESGVKAFSEKKEGNCLSNTKVKQLTVTSQQREEAIRRASSNLEKNKAYQDTKAYIQDKKEKEADHG